MSVFGRTSLASLSHWTFPKVSDATIELENVESRTENDSLPSILRRTIYFEISICPRFYCLEKNKTDREESGLTSTTWVKKVVPMFGSSKSLDTSTRAVE